MAHEECPEVTNNEILKKAAELYLSYSCQISELLKDFTYSQCRELQRICDLAKTNNCSADMYYSLWQVRDTLNTIMLWHKFNRSVHGIDLT